MNITEIRAADSALEIKHHGTISSPPSILVALCFESRTKIHMAHLQTSSYSQHKALEDYYTSIIPAADKFAEAYQGRYNVIDSYPDVLINSIDGLQIVKVVRDWIDQNRKTCGDFSELQNIIDDITGICDSTTYKLAHLK